MKKLKIQANKKHFQAILSGEQKVEHRYVYPTNKDKYVTESDETDENGEAITVVEPVHYDAIQFICGRRKDAPRATVKVVEAEFVILTDEAGNDLTYEENGIEYYVCQVWYTLGDIIDKENIPE